MTTNLNPKQVRVIDPVLTTVAQGYVQPEFVGMTIFPRVGVTTSGGQILEFGKEDFQIYNIRRSPGANTKRISFGYLGKPFALFNDAVEVPVPREYLRDASVPGIDLASRAVNRAMKVVSLGLEREQAALALDASQYPSTNKISLTGTSKWTDPSANISQQIDTYKEAVRLQVGSYPNTLLLSAVAFKAGRNNSGVLDRTKYTSKDSITPEILASLWDLDKVVVGKAVTSGPSGMSDVWGNNAILAYVPSIPTTMEEPSFGYTYCLEGHPLVETPYYDENPKSWIYGVGYERCPVMSGILSGFLIQNPA